MVNNFLKEAVSKIRLVNSEVPPQELQIEKDWNGDICSCKLINTTTQAYKIKEVVLFSLKMPFEPSTLIFGEGYNKLSMYGGTVSELEHIGAYNEITHYNMPQTPGFNKVYNMIMFFQSSAEVTLMGFTSCKRFSGQLRYNNDTLEIVLDFENITIDPGQTIIMEDLFIASGNKNSLLDTYAKIIQSNHPLLKSVEIPTGWCSWPVYGPDVTEQNIYDNMEIIKKDLPELKYIQLDDGYQTYMGDWLTATNFFEGGIKKMCLEIKNQGLEPAIWVAPFIAEENSHLFKSHPDWFVRDDDGSPLPSNKVSFGGWRCGPWYMLDGTHPEARSYLKHVFKTMREEWQIKYYKLDANMWGALPFGTHYEENRTCVEAYRLGMEAILEGAGQDSFILGCNAPMWPSLGLVHGMRITNDAFRRWDVILKLSRECFHRNWQHNKLWITDPDTILLENLEFSIMGPNGSENSVSQVTTDEFMFGAAYILASGGMVLAGDNMAEMSEENKNIIKKLLPPIGTAAIFDDEDYKVGRIRLNDELILCLFNPDDMPCDLNVPVEGYKRAINFWDDTEFGCFSNIITIKNMPPHSAKVLRLK